MINLCTATTIQHWFSKFLKLFGTFCKFHVFVFRYRATNENVELEENKIWVIFYWQNLWEGIRISLGIILRLFYQRRKEIMIFRGFCKFCRINLAVYVFIILFFLFHIIDTLFWGYSIKPQNFTLHYTDFQC